MYTRVGAVLLARRGVPDEEIPTSSSQISQMITNINEPPVQRSSSQQKQQVVESVS